MTQGKAKIILHCGAPKTGSTSLQHYFRACEALLNANAIHYPHRFFSRRDVDPLHRAFVRSRRLKGQSEAIDAARERLDHFFVDASTRAVLISNESLLGEPFLYEEASFFPTAAIALPALREIFSGYDVHVRYFIRSHAGYIPSYYVQHVRRGGTRSFEAFVDGLDLAQLSWTRVITQLEEAFGQRNLKVYDHAALSREPDRVISDMLSNFVDGPLPPLDTRRYRMNRSAGGIALDATRLVNRVLAKAPSLSPYQKGVVTRNLVLKPLSLVTPSGKPRLPSAVEQELDALHGEDRRVLTDL